MKGLSAQVEMRGRENGVAVLRLTGHVDTQTVNVLAKALHQLLEDQVYKIVMDLENTSYISSAGWGVFIGEIKRIRDHDGDLKLSGLSNEVDEVYRVLEFDSILKSYPAVTDALDDF